MYFDAHTHLNSDHFFPSRQKEINFFQQKSGIGLINIGVNKTYNQRGITIASESLKKFPDMIIKCTIGLHPYEVSIGNITSHNIKQKLEELYSLYEENNKKHIVAIGEIGIDTHFPGSESTLSLQKELFGLQCQRARTLKLPIVIHTRSNRDATFEVLKDYKDLTVYFHCRSYTTKEIKTIQKTFPSYYVGFDGNISYSQAKNIRKSLRYLVYGTTDYPEHLEQGIRHIENQQKKESCTGIHSLLLETDSPYLPFKNRRGQLQHSHYIGDIYTYVSSLLGLTINDQVVKNTKQCYNIQINSP